MYLDIGGHDYPYIASKTIHPSRGEDQIHLAALAWYSTIEGQVLVKASFHLDDPSPSGDGVEVDIEVDGGSRSRGHILLPSRPDHEIAANVQVGKGSVVRVVTHPREDPHHDTVKVSFTISDVRGEDTITATQ